MNMAVTVSKGAPASRSPSTLVYEWPSSLTAELQAEILTVMNLVLARETTIGFPGPLSISEGMAVMRDVASSVASGKKHVMLVRNADNAQVVGHSILTPNSLPNCRHIGEISRTFVHPEFRGVVSMRVGLSHILARCEQIGVEVLQLDVRANTRIHKLWEALGFQTIGFMQDYARVNGEKFTGCFLYQTVAELKRRFENE